MKEVNNGILDNDMVISVENVQKMGEVIALTCIKTVGISFYCFKSPIIAPFESNSIFLLFTAVKTYPNNITTVSKFSNIVI